MSSGSFSSIYLALVEAALPPIGGATPQQLYRVIDVGALRSVRYALSDLVKAGRVSFEGEPCKRLYRRAALSTKIEAT